MHFRYQFYSVREIPAKKMLPFKDRFYFLSVRGEQIIKTVDLLLFFFGNNARTALFGRKVLLGEVVNLEARGRAGSWSFVQV